MLKAPLPDDEHERLEALRRYLVLDTPSEPFYDELATLVAHVCEAPIALISLIDERRQWFKAKLGLMIDETPRDVAFCAHVVHQKEMLIVPDAHEDDRFADHPLVVSDPHIRFYAGAPLLTPAGHVLGTLCVIDRVPRELSARQKAALRLLSRVVITQLELEYAQRELRGAHSSLQKRVEERTAELASANQALQESEQRLRAIVDSEPECVTLIAPDGRLTDINPAGLAMIEADSREQVLGQSVLNLIAPSHHESYRDLHQRVIRGESATLEFEIIGFKGTRRWLDTNAVPLRDMRNEITALLGITRDITERRQVQLERERLLAELRSCNAEMESFVYTISHDLKSPLITIGGFASLATKDLARGDLRAAQDSLGEIRQAVNDMQRLIGDLLDLSRTGHIAGEPEPMALGVVVEAVIHRLSERIQRLDAAVEAAPDLPAICADRTRIEQVFQNLIDNALKYSRKDVKPLIQIGFVRTKDDLRLYVRDNGRGIKKAYQERIFGLFERVDAKTEGTGIGLAISRRIVEVHGGRLWVESEPGQGSIFWISLPLSVIVNSGGYDRDNVNGADRSNEADTTP